MSRYVTVCHAVSRCVTVCHGVSRCWNIYMYIYSNTCINMSSPIMATWHMYIYIYIYSIYNYSYNNIIYNVYVCVNICVYTYTLHEFFSFLWPDGTHMQCTNMLIGRYMQLHILPRYWFCLKI